MVIEVLTRPRGMPSNSVSMSSRLHIGTPTLPTSPFRQWVVGVVADLRGQVEGDGQPGLALLQQVAEAAVGVLGGGVARILAHGPHPAPVGAGLDPAGVGELAGEADVFGVVVRPVGQVFGGVQRVNGKAAVGLEGGTAFRVALHRRSQGFLAPLLLVLAGHNALLTCRLYRFRRRLRHQTHS